LLVTDLDGTLLDSNGEVHERDRTAIAELSRRGIAVSVCTGRMYSGTRAIAHEIGVRGPVACIDGSHIVDVATDRELHARHIDSSALTPLIRQLREAELAAFAFADDTVLHDDDGLPFLGYVSTWSRRAEPLPSVLDAEAFRGRSVSAVVALGIAETVEATASFVRALLSDALQVITFSVSRNGLHGTSGMVIRATGATKGTALAWIARHYGLDTSEVVAVGDWLNDIPMLRAAGRSFVMAQAPDEVKAAATDELQADFMSGGGIAEAADRAGLL